MKPSDAQNTEEVLFELMAEYDEALASDTPTEQIEQTAADLDPQLTAQWESAKSCMIRLERLRRHGELPRPASAVASSIKAPATGTPRRVGRFLLERELGRGGLGIVYLAHDPQLGRKVALKIPRFEALMDEGLRARFLREAEAAARLNHPHLIALYEVGEDGTICYLASEYCSGPTLAQWLRGRERPVPFAEAARVVALLAEAVTHAHSRGVLHRDIKPSNVMLSATDNNEGATSAGLPKLTDFGMAKLLEQDGGDRTRTGVLVGTLAYMAPEQVEGRTRELDVRADVYALGAILYELLTGNAPYGGQSDVEILRQVIAREPTLPRRLRPDVPRDLEAIALKCLAKNPAGRYATARELADDLQRFIDGRPTAARPLKSSERAMKWVKRRPAIAALIAVATVSLTIFLGGSLWFNRQLAASLRVANIERQRVADEQTRTARMLYASQMRTAQQAWRDGNLRRLREILERYAEGTPDAGLRHFEWYHLNHLANLPHREFHGHEGEVYGVAYAPDGRTIITSGQDATVRFWDVASGEMLAVGRDHTSCVNGVDFSPDGDTFVTYSCDKTIKLWSLNQRKVLATLTGHTQQVDACVFIDGGRLLVSLSHDLAGTPGLRDARIWDVATRQVRTDWPPPGEIIEGLVAGRSGNTLVTFAKTRAVVWKRQGESWALSHRCGRVEPVPGGILPPDEEFAMVPKAPRGLQIIRLRDGTVTSELNDFTGLVRGINVSPAGTCMATTSGDGAIRVFRYPSGKLEHCLLGHQGQTWQVAWSPDSKSLASVGNDGILRIWDLELGTERIHLRAPQDRIPVVDKRWDWDFAFLQDGNLVNAAYNDFYLTWDLQTGRIVPDEHVAGPRWPKSFVHEAFHDDSHILAAQWDSQAYHMPPRLSRDVIGIPTNSIDCLRIIGDGRQLAQIRNGEFRRWDIESLQLLEERPIKNLNLPAILFDLSQDGQRLCGAHADGTVEVRDLPRETGISLGKFPTVRGARFSPNGERVLVFSDSLAEYDTRTGKQTRYYTQGRESEATYSADGQRIAVSSYLEFIMIYDAVTGEETLRLDGGAATLFSREGTSFLSQSSPYGLYFWPGKK
jgi:serine/threonine protein kinase/WD40 repeat protein